MPYLSVSASRHHLHAEDARALGLVDLGHLRQAGHLALDQVVREVHEKGLRSHGRLRAQHRVPEPEGRRLADVDAGGVGRQHAAQLVRQVALALTLEELLELLVGIEVILDGALGGAGDKHQARDARGQRLFHRVLDERLVDDRQHFLGTRLGGGQEASAAPGHRKDGGSDHGLRCHPHGSSPAKVVACRQVYPSVGSQRTCRVRKTPFPRSSPPI